VVKVGATFDPHRRGRPFPRPGTCSPQYSLAKSFAGFASTGPALVMLDELVDPGDLELGCSLNGEEVQRACSSDMIFSIPDLVSYLSGIVTLHPGGVTFTGTPSGDGMGRTPPHFLAPGDRLDSWIEGIGEPHQTFVASR
jgi:2-keto-4-pentenoate hydratase/2-oxohepta-3-ene-1,7-dioic acid hydratase in catechol pathway